MIKLTVFRGEIYSPFAFICGYAVRHAAVCREVESTMRRCAVMITKGACCKLGGAVGAGMAKCTNCGAEIW